MATAALAALFSIAINSALVRVIVLIEAAGLTPLPATLAGCLLGVWYAGEPGAGPRGCGCVGGPGGLGDPLVDMLGDAAVPALLGVPD